MRGFTLLEMIVVAVLVAAMIASIASFYASFNRFYTYQNTAATNARTTGKALADIEAYVIAASSVQTSHTFATGTYSTGTNVLVLELPSVTSSDDVISGSYDYVAYYVSSGTLYRRLEKSGSSARVTGTTTLASGVSTLTFSYDSGTYANVTHVSTDLTTQASHRAGTVSTHLTNQAYLRN